MLQSLPPPPSFHSADAGYWNFVSFRSSRRDAVALLILAEHNEAFRGASVLFSYRVLSDKQAVRAGCHLSEAPQRRLCVLGHGH